MVKQDPNIDGGLLFLTNREVQAGLPKDFVSIGSADCEDYICVYDSTFVNSGLDPNATAHGYCSKSCVAADSCASATRMACRPLLVDAESKNFCTREWRYDP